ncbi:GyrI-like domain-containing protein [Paenibacillus sp. URB8-2]|uniref:GyrI-like domain-containing protein n=1 Tax=Paenibacillus sp. URB8-2 TaxID=2741301 RepID=UPI0015BAA0B3|nr:GyrI-like domain-containing protein [Paenibacillus sp. URB8-2]BCG60766.1 AraC family transcriptional regulator [Paenibacillus sp. URB8-2]
MEVLIEEKQSFTVIGKVGQGLSSESTEWIPKLWQEANRNFSEISSLAKTDSAGNLVGIWGAMSDVSERFERWTEQGKYLAGCEVLDGSVAPNGWTKWVIPSYKFAVMKCNQNTYRDKFKYMVNEYIPNHNYSIVGAVHEYYNPSEANGDLYLYFPIERIYNK